MNLFNLSLKFNGFPIDEAKAKLKTIQSKNEDEFKIYVEEKKQEIVSYHLKHNLFYKNFVKNPDKLDWNSIPIMTKKDLQQPLNNRLLLFFIISRLMYPNKVLAKKMYDSKSKYPYPKCIL